MSAPFSMAIITPSRPTGLQPFPVRISLGTYQLALTAWFLDDVTLFCRQRATQKAP